MSHGGTTPVAPVGYVKLWVVARSFVLFHLFWGRVEEQNLVYRLCPLAESRELSPLLLLLGLCCHTHGSYIG